MRIYISHPMSGSADQGVSRGEHLAEQLRKKYSWYEFIAPHEIMHSADGLDNFNPLFSHADYIRDDIHQGLSKCAAIALDVGWPTSSGCLLEVQYAAVTGKRFFQIVYGAYGVAYGLDLLPVDGL